MFKTGLGKNASNLTSQGDMGWSSCAHKQKIEAFRLYFKIQRTTENRLVNKIFKWSSTHGKSWELTFQSSMRVYNLQTYLEKNRIVSEKLS